MALACEDNGWNIYTGVKSCVRPLYVDNVSGALQCTNGICFCKRDRDQHSPDC